MKGHNATSSPLTLVKTIKESSSSPTRMKLVTAVIFVTADLWLAGHSPGLDLDDRKLARSLVGQFEP